ncbi:hypothetical protein HK101_001015 [Irineochytrium annulatum]|nr:hypothetical protein HK101_001015 [Irineochytrium annulatum]
MLSTSFVVALVGSAVMLVQAAQQQSYDIATGSRVVASSTYNVGPCSNNSCAATNVILADPNVDAPNPLQWISQPGSCDASRNETMSFDWSAKYQTQLLSEVRFRYGDLAASSVGLILYSEVPMNIPNPTAVTYEDTAQWIVFVFNTPVTASGMQLMWTGLGSKDGGSTCYVAVSDVQAWTGPSPDGIPNPNANNNAVRDPNASNGGSPSKGPSALVITLAVILPLLAIAIVAGVIILRTRRANLLKSRLAREVEAARRQQADAGVDGRKTLSPRTLNYLNAQKQAAAGGISNPTPV